MSPETVKTDFVAGVAVAEQAVIAEAVTAVPPLGFPFFHFLFTWVVDWTISKLMPYMTAWLVDTVVDIQVNAQKKAFENARDELQAVLKAHVASPVEVQNASDDFDKRLASLVRFNP